MGPEAIQTYVNPEEVIKRLAAAQGIDVLNLVKSMQEVQQQEAAAMQQQQQMELAKQAGQLASAPINDPSKNPQLNGQQASSEAPPAQ